MLNLPLDRFWGPQDAFFCFSSFGPFFFWSPIFLRREGCCRFFLSIFLFCLFRVASQQNSPFILCTSPTPSPLSPLPPSDHQTGPTISERRVRGGFWFGAASPRQFHVRRQASEDRIETPRHDQQILRSCGDGFHSLLREMEEFECTWPRMSEDLQGELPVFDFYCLVFC